MKCFRLLLLTLLFFVASAYSQGIIPQAIANDEVQVSLDAPVGGVAKNHYKIGEILTLYISTKRNGYLYIINIEANNQSFLLFPNNFNEADFYIYAGEQVLPPQGANYNFRISENTPLGLTKIVAFVSPTPIEKNALTNIERKFANQAQNSISALQLGNIVWGDASFYVNAVASNTDNTTSTATTSTATTQPTLAPAQSSETTFGNLSLSSSPSGATVTLNGQNLGQTPLNKTLSAGQYSLRLEVSGHRVYNQTILISAGQTLAVNETLAPLVTSSVPSNVPSNVPTIAPTTSAQATYGNLSISSNPSGATVLLNGQNLGQAPFSKTLSAGQYNLRLELSNYNTVEKTIQVPLGQTLTINETLSPLVTSNAPDPALAPIASAQTTYGNLSVSSSPSGARVILNGQNLGQAPFSKTLSAGQYNLRLELSNYNTVEKTIQIPLGQTLTINETLSSSVTSSAPAASAATSAQTGYGNLSVSSSPSGATVLLNGQNLGQTPLNKTLSAGQYSLRLEISNYRVYDQTILISAGHTLAINEILNPLVTSNAPTVAPTTSSQTTYGNLSVSSNPSGARVILNGQNLGQVPLNKTLSAGQYTLRLELSNYSPIEKTIQVPVGQTLAVNETLTAVITNDVSTPVPTPALTPAPAPAPASSSSPATYSSVPTTAPASSIKNSSGFLDIPELKIRVYPNSNLISQQVNNNYFEAVFETNDTIQQTFSHYDAQLVNNGLKRRYQKSFFDTENNIYNVVYTQSNGRQITMILSHQKPRRLLEIVLSGGP